MEKRLTVNLSRTWSPHKDIGINISLPPIIQNQTILVQPTKAQLEPVDSKTPVLEQLPSFKLFYLPVELLGKISNYCFKEFRTGSRFMRDCAFPWNTLKKTQANCLILGKLGDLQTKWEIGKIERTLVFACETGNANLFKTAFKIKPYCLMDLENTMKAYTGYSCYNWRTHDIRSISGQIRYLWNLFDGHTNMGDSSENTCGFIYIFKNKTGLLLIHSCTIKNTLRIIAH